MFGKKKKNPGYSYFSSDVTLEGRLCFTGIVRLDGRINGEIISTGTLVVEATAIITGDILVENIILNGTVYGNIQASRQVQLNPTARVYGHINYGELSIEGAMHEGSSHKLSPDEIALVQREYAELMAETVARVEKYVPDLSDADRCALNPGLSPKRIAAATVKTSPAALPADEQPKPAPPRPADEQPKPAPPRPIADQAKPAPPRPGADQVKAAEHRPAKNHPPHRHAPPNHKGSEASYPKAAVKAPEPEQPKEAEPGPAKGDEPGPPKTVESRPSNDSSLDKSTAPA